MVVCWVLRHICAGEGLIKRGQQRQKAFLMAGTARRRVDLLCSGCGTIKYNLMYVSYSAHKEYKRDKGFGVGGLGRELPLFCAAVFWLRSTAVELWTPTGTATL
jgi:hypothetical protein